MKQFSIFNFQFSKFRSHLPFLLPLWLIPLGVYLYTKAPSILYIDAGTIVAAAFEPGIPNPPGFPFYVLIAHLFTKIPFGTVLFRVQLLSILSAAGVLTLVYFLIHRLITTDFVFVIGTKSDRDLFKNSFARIKKDKKLPGLLIKIISLTTAFILGFSYQFWSQTLNTESYVFTNLLLISLLTIVLTVPISAKAITKRIFLAAAFLGIASGANPTISQVVPSLIISVVMFWKKIGWKKLAMMGILAAFFSAAVYSYLPLRAKQYPFLNWGNPQTPQLFLDHLHGAGLNIYDPRTNSINGFTGSPKIFVQSLGRYIYLLMFQFTPVLVPLILIGGFYLFKKNRKLLLLFLAVPATNMFYGALYLSGNQESWFIASYVIFSLLIGIGLSFAVKVIADIKLKYLKYAPALLVLVLIPAIWWFPKLNRHDFIVTQEYANNLYANLLPNSVLIGSGDFFNQLTHYEYGVVQKRKDVFPVVANMWYILPWYRDTLRKHRPDLMPKELEGMIKKDRLEEYNEVMNWWIRGLIDKGVPVYVTPMVFRETVLAGTDAGKYVPDKEKVKTVNNGLTFRMLTSKDLLQPTEDSFKYQFKDPRFYEKPPFYLERNYNAAFNLMLREYGSSFAAMGDYFLGIGDKDKELEYLKTAYAVAPFSAEIVNRLGIYAVSIGDIQAAARYFKEAAENDKGSFEVRLNLARSLMALGQLNESAKLLQEITQKADNPKLKEEAQNELARINLKNIARQIPLDWKDFESKQGLAFKYPPEWNVSSSGAVVIISDGENKFTVSLYAGKLTEGGDAKKWAASSPVRFSGKKEQEGKAQIPGFDANASFYTDARGVKLLEFILVSEEVLKDGARWVIHMKMRPSDSPSMQKLDQILSSLRFL